MRGDPYTERNETVVVDPKNRVTQPVSSGLRSKKGTTYVIESCDFSSIIRIEKWSKKSQLTWGENEAPITFPCILGLNCISKTNVCPSLLASYER